MQIILKHIFRNIRKHKMRSFLIFVSLLVSTSVFTISLTISDDLEIKVEDTLRNVYGNAEVKIKTVDKFKMSNLKTNKEKYTYVGFNLLETLNEKKEPVLLNGCDFNKTVEFKMLGNDVKPLLKNEVYINKRLASEKKYKKGDVIKVIYKNKKYTFIIKDIIENKGIASIKTDYDSFYTSLETINEIKKVENDYYDSVFLDIEDNNKIDDFVNYLKDHNTNYSITKTVDIESIKDATSMIRTIMFLILLMATIMIFFVVGSLNKIIIAERVPVIGTFRSIGASRFKMNMILVLENAIYGVFAGFFGTIIGTILDSSVSNAFITSDGIDISKSSVSISPTTILIGILFAVSLQILITIKEIIRTNKKPIKDLIFNTQNTRYRLRTIRTIVGFMLLIISTMLLIFYKRLSTVSVGICLIIFIIGIANTLPFLFQMISKLLTAFFKKIGWATGIVSAKNIGYNKRIISSSRLIVIAISLLTSIIMMSNAISNAFTTFKETTKNIDIIVEGLSHENKKYNYLSNIKGVKHVNFLNTYFPEEATYNNNKKFSVLPILYAEEERNKNEIKEINYKIKDLKKGEILIDEKYAYKNKFDIGDELTIKYGSKNKSFTYKVVGFIDSSNFTTSRNVMVVTYKHLIKDLNNVPYMINITLNNKKDTKKMKDVIKNRIKEIGITVQTTDEFISEQETQTQGIVAIVYLIIGISVVLAFIGVINNQIISFASRKKELSVLNSTCMSRNQIRKMLAFEILLSNFISLFIAVLIASILPIFVDKFLVNIGMYLNVEFNLSVAIDFALIAYSILFLTLVIPFRKLRKMNVVDEIKYE